MVASPDSCAHTPLDRGPLRLALDASPPPGSPEGAWWPWSRDLAAEAADLVDHFPTSVGRINRLLYSRPDWDVTGSAIRRVAASRGPVKIGSFPSDDTHLMVLTLASGRRMKLLVVPSDAVRREGERLLDAAGRIDMTPGDGVDWDRWDDEDPHG